MTLMLGQREAVGHASDEIANPPGARRLALLCGPFKPLRREVARVLLVAREEIEHDLPGISHDPHHPLVAVHMLLQERLDAGFRLCDARSKGDELLAMMSDIFSRLRPREI